MKKCPKCGTEYPDTTTLCPADGVALERIGDSLVGQTLAGKYRIDKRLSEGGMGTVYRGTHVLMDKTVAVKVLRPSLAADEKIVARFSREARAASRISHPNALSVTDFGEDEQGRVFLVMEYLQGNTLKQTIREAGPMTLTRVVEIVRQVGGALDAAHAEGIVHRDLKSENIMLLNASGRDYAKVLDFGIAKITEREGTYDPSLTAPDLVMGTPQYMSPEQCSQAAEIDARSDIYSLGIILYEMLVGHVPFSGESPTAVMLKHLQEPAPSILLERKLPALVDKVVAKALAKRPEDRYQKVGELVEDLTIAASFEEKAATLPRDEFPQSLNITPPQNSEAGMVDEETVVRPRIRERPAIVVPTAPPARPRAFSPLKILIGSSAALLVVFAVIYALTRSDSATNKPPQGPTLVADPNSKPVEPVQPATGKPEEGIPASQALRTNSNVNAMAESSPSPTATAAADQSASPGPSESPAASVNSNTAASPVPVPSPRIIVNEPPPPPPTPASSSTPAPKTNPTIPKAALTAPPH